MRRRPVIALLFLLAGMACEDAQLPPVVEQTLFPDSADQMLFGVRFNLTDGGVLRAEVLADTLLMYEDNTRSELRRVTTMFHNETGERDATLTSQQGTYNVRLGTMEARGDVVVVSTDGRKLETQQLRYDPGRNEITSDSAFTLTEGDRVSQGIGFRSDPEMNNITVLRALKTTGQPVTIPKR